MRKGDLRFNIAILLLFILGALVLLYPTISNMWNEYRNSLLIAEYEKQVEILPDEESVRIFDEARNYNRNHTENMIRDAFIEPGDVFEEYNSILNPIGDGVMGYLEIDSIGVKLPIFHGTSEETISTGCGHVGGTSFPVGGGGTHAVLSSHRGLPSAKLFTDLDKLGEGDVFVITVLTEKLAYEVDQIKVVLPEDLDYLQIEEGKDYVTLLTCTPYGVNTHRMLVRGHRVDFEEKGEVVTIDDIVESGLAVKLLIIGIVVCISLIIIVWVMFRKKSKRRK